MRYISTIGEHEYSIEIIDERHILLDGEILEFDFDAITGQAVYSLLVNGKSYEAYVYPQDDVCQVILYGSAFPVRIEDEREHQLRSTFGRQKGEQAEFHLRAPMPGLVVSIPVREGQEVQEGDVLVILESMKMQNELRSPRAGRVVSLMVQTGDCLNQNETLLSVV